MSMHGYGFGDHLSQIACVGSTIVTGVGIQAFSPGTAMRYADAIVVVRRRSKVANDDQFLMGCMPKSHEAENRVVPIICANPAKSLCISVTGKQGWL
jgi:hypothetical protein